MTEDQSAAAYWNSIIHTLPGVHLLQTWEWGHIKSQFGWQPLYAIWLREKPLILLTEEQLNQRAIQPQTWNNDEITAAALILKRTVPVPGLSTRLSVLYIPKAPLLNWADEQTASGVLGDIQRLARQQGGIFLKIDPDVCLGRGIPNPSDEITDPVGQFLITQLKTRQWKFSKEQVQFRNTVSIDLTPNEDLLLGQMKQKARYNIRLAKRKGVTIRLGNASDISLLYRMYAETSLRDRFTIREENYYQTVLRTYLANPTDQPANYPTVKLFIAEVNSEPVAALVIFIFARKAWYLYGMSRTEHREKMPNYLLQWEAIRSAKQAGCISYDLWGAPDQFNETDPMWGVYRFKEGLGGELIRHIGAWDYPVSPILYHLYTQTLPHLLDLMRSRQKTQTQNIVE
jgi:lipid II:glycine glycyltransferase (peptidoglycan interpeptide bridge formation enzyme)